MDYSSLVFRPIGHVIIGMWEAQNLSLPGCSVACRAIWDPIRRDDDDNAEPKQERKKKETHRIAHNVGETSFVFNANPVWDKTTYSKEHVEIRKLMESACDTSDQKATTKKRRSRGQSKNQNCDLELPLLQPTVQTKDGNTIPSLAPWKETPGCLVFQIRYRDMLNHLPGFEEVLGEVAIPLSQVVQRKTIEGWYPLRLFDARILDPPSKGPKIYLRIRWEPPTKAAGEAISDTDRETSILLAEGIGRRLGNEKVTSRIDALIGSSLGAFKTVRGLGSTVSKIQVSLAFFLDHLEQFKSALNFTVRQNNDYSNVIMM